MIGFRPPNENLFRLETLETLSQRGKIMTKTFQELLFSSVSKIASKRLTPSYAKKKLDELAFSEYVKKNGTPLNQTIYLKGNNND